MPPCEVPKDLENRGIAEVFKPGIAKLLIESGARVIGDLEGKDLTSIPGIGEAKRTQIEATLSGSHEKRIRQLEAQVEELFKLLRGK